MDAAQTWFVIIGVAELLLWALAALRPVRIPAAGTVLQYGAKLRWFGLAVALLIPTILIAAMLLIPFPHTGRLVLLGVNLAVLGLVGGVLLLETQRSRIVVNDSGVVGVSPWRRTHSFSWSEIHAVTYTPLDHCLILHATGGRRIRASLYLRGIEELTRSIKHKLPADRYASAVKRLG
jgi:hypothetical protein